MRRLLCRHSRDRVCNRILPRGNKDTTIPDCFNSTAALTMRIAPTSQCGPSRVARDANGTKRVVRLRLICTLAVPWFAIAFEESISAQPATVHIFTITVRRGRVLRPQFIGSKSDAPLRAVWSVCSRLRDTANDETNPSAQDDNPRERRAAQCECRNVLSCRGMTWPL
jgi:hypothetical protein